MPALSTTTRTWAGVAAWAAFVWWRVPNLEHDAWALALLLFAALVLVPLALDLFGPDAEPSEITRQFALARGVQLPAALLLTLSCWLRPGAGAFVAAIPWAAFTALLAVIGVQRLRREGWRRSLDGMCADIALIYSAVGGAWTLADRAGYAPLAFDPSIVALTAVHFHFAGLLLPLFAGLVQRELWFWRFASRAAVGVVLGVPLVALGITASQLRWGSNVETAAGLWLALAGGAVAILHVRIALEAKRDGLTRTLLGVAGASLFFGMVLAALHALRATSFAPWLGLPQMRMLHGTINALGFGLCGALGWRRMERGQAVIAGDRP